MQPTVMISSASISQPGQILNADKIVTSTTCSTATVASSALEVSAAPTSPVTTKAEPLPPIISSVVQNDINEQTSVIVIPWGWKRNLVTDQIFYLRYLIF